MFVFRMKIELFKSCGGRKKRNWWKIELQEEKFTTGFFFVCFIINLIYHNFDFYVFLRLLDYDFIKNHTQQLNTFQDFLFFLLIPPNISPFLFIPSAKWIFMIEWLNKEMKKKSDCEEKCLCLFYDENTIYVWCPSVVRWRVYNA